MIKIIIGSLTYPLPNGVTASIDTSVDSLSEQGFRFIVVAPRYEKRKHRLQHYQAPSSPVTRAIGYFMGRKEKTFGLTAPFYIKKIVKNFNPDIYWLHNFAWAPNAFEIHMFNSNKPKVLSYHTLVEEYGQMYGGKVGADLMKHRSKLIGNKVDAIIVPNEKIEKKLRQYGIIKPIHIIPTAITLPSSYLSKKDLLKKINIPFDSKIILYVGRVCKEKNIEILLRAMGEIRKKNEKIFLLVVGAGDIVKFKSKARKMKVADRVIFHGHYSLEETKKMYGGSDLFVFPSKKTETQGLVIGEAMIAGIPVVAFSSQAKTGVYPEKLFFSVKKESDLHLKILEAFNESNKKDKIVKDAKKFILENFSEEKIAEKQKKLFLSLVSRKN